VGRGLPDHTLGIGVTVELTAPDVLRVIPKPEGAVYKHATLAATTDVYQDVVAYTPTSGKTFYLAKIVISCTEDSWIRLRWGGGVIYGPILVSAVVPFTDWFAWNWRSMAGDGAKVFDIQAKYDATSGSVYAELVGEEV